MRGFHFRKPCSSDMYGEPYGGLYGLVRGLRGRLPGAAPVVIVGTREQGDLDSPGSRHAGVACDAAASRSGRRSRRSGWGRGTLSQVENGKARPSRALVEWYEDDLRRRRAAAVRLRRGPRCAPQRAPRRTAAAPAPTATTSSGATRCRPPARSSAAGRTVTVGWTLRNTGTVPWVGRRLRRVGAHAAAQLLTSRHAVGSRRLRPGGEVDARVEVTTPPAPARSRPTGRSSTREGRPCFPIARCCAACSWSADRPAGCRPAQRSRPCGRPSPSAP